MMKKRWRKVAILRKVLTFSIGAIALLALLYVHVVFPASEVTKLPDKLPTQHETSYQRLSRERSWIQELSPPHLPKAPLAARKI